MLEDTSSYTISPTSKMVTEFILNNYTLIPKKTPSAVILSNCTLNSLTVLSSICHNVDVLDFKVHQLLLQNKVLVPVKLSFL